MNSLTHSLALTQMVSDRVGESVQHLLVLVYASVEKALAKRDSLLNMPLSMGRRDSKKPSKATADSTEYPPAEEQPALASRGRSEEAPTTGANVVDDDKAASAKDKKKRESSTTALKEKLRNQLAGLDSINIKSSSIKAGKKAAADQQQAAESAASATARPAAAASSVAAASAGPAPARRRRIESSESEAAPPATATPAAEQPSAPRRRRIEPLSETSEDATTAMKRDLGNQLSGLERATNAMLDRRLEQEDRGDAKRIVEGARREAVGTTPWLGEKKKARGGNGAAAARKSSEVHVGLPPPSRVGAVGGRDVGGSAVVGVGVGGFEVAPSEEFDEAEPEEPAMAARLEEEQRLLASQAAQVMALARQLKRPASVPGLVSVGGATAMLVGADEVVREVHTAMVAWDGSAGGLSRLREVHEASNLTAEQRKLLAHAATEVRLARRAHVVQQERLRREREALAEGVQELVWSLAPTIRAVKERARKGPDEAEKGAFGIDMMASAVDAGEAEAEDDVVRSGKQRPPEPSLTRSVSRSAVAAPPPAKQQRQSATGGGAAGAGGRSSSTSVSFADGGGYHGASTSGEARSGGRSRRRSRLPNGVAAAECSGGDTSGDAFGGAGGGYGLGTGDGGSGGGGAARTLEVSASIQHRQPAHAPPTPGTAGGDTGAPPAAPWDATPLPSAPLPDFSSVPPPAPYAPVPSQSTQQQATSFSTTYSSSSSSASASASAAAAAAAAAAFAAKYASAAPPAPAAAPPAAAAAVPVAMPQRPAWMGPSRVPGIGGAAPAAPGGGVSAAVNYLTAAATSHLLRQRNHGKASVDVEAALRYAQSVVDVGGWQTPLTPQTIGAARATLSALVSSWHVAAATASQPPAAAAAACDDTTTARPVGVWTSHQHAVTA